MSTPNSLKFLELPIPDVCKICGDPIDPDESIISLLAETFLSSFPIQYSTFLAVLFSKFIFLTCAFVIIFKLFLFLIGLR